MKPGRHTGYPKRLLVIRLGALGDLIHLTPALAAVKTAYPETELHLLTSEAYQPLAEMMPDMDRIWTWRRGPGGESLFALATRLRKAQFDGVVNLHPSLKTWLLTQLTARTARQAVYRKEKLRQKGIAQRGIIRRHAVEDFYQPFRMLPGFSKLPHHPTGTPRLDPKPVSSIPLKPEGERWIGIIPGVGTKRSNRAWETASYQALIEKLLAASPDIRVLLIGGPDETLLAEGLMRGITRHRERLENHCGRHAIPETAALLAQCDRVIGGDTGPMHLAAAVGAPLVGIYGPTALARTGPRGRTDIHALTPPDNLACWPCEKPVCPLKGEAHLACMRQITVESVFSASLPLLIG